MFFDFGTGIPQLKDVLLTDRSFKPFPTNFITSFLLDAGRINFDSFYIVLKVYHPILTI